MHKKYCLEKFKNNPNVIKYIQFLSDEYCEYIVYEYINNAIKHIKSKCISYKIGWFLDGFFKFHSEKDKKMILLPIFQNNILIKDNFDIILLGFRYLNVYNDNNSDNDNIEEYLKNNILFNKEYIHDIKNFFSINYNDHGFDIQKKKFDNFKIDKQIKLQKEIKSGKIIPMKEYILILQNNSLIIYSKKNLNMMTKMLFPEKEGDLLNVAIIDTNIMIVLNKYKIFNVSFDNNNLNIIDIIENIYLQEKYNINLFKNEKIENIFLMKLLISTN